MAAVARLGHTHCVSEVPYNASEAEHSGDPSSIAPEAVGSARPTDSSTVVETEMRSADGFTLSHSNQLVGGMLLAIVLTLAVLQWGRLSGWGVHPVEISELPPIENQFQLNVNTATAIEWAQLDGIGEVLAERIVEDRKSNGNFDSVDDLSRVEGIGGQTLEQIRPWLTVKQND